MSGKFVKFTKMQGAGNDYVYIDTMTNDLTNVDKESLVRRLSDRHFGIGSDGVIFINKDKDADFEMEMYNADGTRAQMCGNGIRCVAKYVYDKHFTNKDKGLVISSFGKNKILDLTLKDGIVDMVKVDMGSPILDAKSIPLSSKFADLDEVVKKDIEILGRKFQMTCVSMGNPHAVVFLDDTDDLESFDIEKYGPVFENHPYFPERTNTEFVKVDDRHNIHMRVWERGTGETLACGTGCCACVVAMNLCELGDGEINVNVLGGVIKCEWDKDLNTVFMTGPATTVFEGQIEL